MVVLIRIIVASSSRSTVSLLARDVLSDSAKTANYITCCSRFLLHSREHPYHWRVLLFVCYMAVSV